MSKKMEKYDREEIIMTDSPTALENSVLTDALENFVFSDIPNYCNFHGLYQLILAYHLERETDLHFVEIGTWLGHSTAYMADLIRQAQKNSGLQIQFDSIDLFKLGEHSDSDHFKQLGVPEHTDYDFFKVTKNNIKKCGVLDYVNLIQEDSKVASQLYADQSLDFVFIDAGHTYKEVMQDIAFWWRKVKLGGILAGDDYNWEEVAKAVRDFAQIRETFDLIKIRNSWVIGKDMEMKDLAEKLQEISV